ncbi:hypothetical protein BDZ85DRAFT_268767 [Elsinoe ampelina]|uniref:F-box domain-containing protein n=1 Tax=Elsinoe ampelina TaxID=302913 RepID=A0A6A6G0Z4_9PEZI|nr:hypothetical protein BDZ85DRAFT_268767 [Elsinoe ampelina]
MKRSRELYDEAPPQIKRTRLDPSWVDRLSILSQELILRILSSLPVTDLVVCHRVSRHFKDLAADSQLWKAHYYNRFVRPRASRIPGIRESEDSDQRLHFSSKVSRWLDEDGLVKKGHTTNWKRQYKLRHNWSQGTCSVSEVAVSEQVSIPPLLVQMRESTIFMADRADGLRAWNSTSGAEMLAVTNIHGSSSPPTSLAVDASKISEDTTLVATGFQDGSFDINELDHRSRVFRLRYRHPASSNGMLSAVAFSFPYLATMTANQLLSVYKFRDPSAANLSSPTLVHSLHSHTSYPPLSLSIRPSPSAILVSIAYTLRSYLSGWTVGIQELHLSPTDSTLLNSRLVSAISPSPSVPRFQQSNYSVFPFTSTDPQQTTSSFFRETAHTEIHTLPTSLSYNHPYLLVSHADNTLTLYLVTSTSTTLTISPGRRLWGHTSSVSGTTIGLRGRAVSVTKRGDEVRLWNLEDTARSKRAPEGTTSRGEGSVRVTPASPSPRSPRSVESALPASLERGLAGAALERTTGSVEGSVVPVEDVGPVGVDPSIGETVSWWSEWYRGTEEEETSIARGWVGFDEENVVLLKERMGGGQSLVVYDFA